MGDDIHEIISNYDIAFFLKEHGGKTRLATTIGAEGVIEKCLNTVNFDIDSPRKINIFLLVLIATNSKHVGSACTQ